MRHDAGTNHKLLFLSVHLTLLLIQIIFKWDDNAVMMHKFQPRQRRMNKKSDVVHALKLYIKNPAGEKD